MKANNLTISIPADCNRNCPFCISNMTFSPEANEKLFWQNLQEARKLAEMAQVSSVLLSSKGEPLNNMISTETALITFDDFPTELQTNGQFINEESIGILRANRLNVLALSVWDSNSFKIVEKVVPLANKYGMIVRLTIVVTSMFKEPFKSIISACKMYGIRQLTFRKCSLPTNIIDTTKAKTTANWIRKHNANDSILTDLEIACADSNSFVRSLPFDGGRVKVYDIEGIGVTKIDYCIQEDHTENDMRSLIYHQDGHMYTSWDKPGSILF